MIGDKNNGGIERHKSEKHGKGLYECGLLGFIERENAKYWIKEINNWIEDLAEATKNWNKDEVLSEMESNTDYCILSSIAHREIDNIDLTHLWVILN